MCIYAHLMRICTYVKRTAQEEGAVPGQPGSNNCPRERQRHRPVTMDDGAPQARTTRLAAGLTRIKTVETISCVITRALAAPAWRLSATMDSSWIHNAS